jgi:flagellar basal-body rod protein FlgB
MFTTDVLNSGAIPTLEAMLRFSGARHRIIAANIANADTPNFIPVDVSPQAFQKQLSDAIDRRRGETGGMNGELELGSTRQVQQAHDGSLQLSPMTPYRGILFHDRNNRDLETMMKDQAENFGVYRVASELLRNRMQQIRDAIGERVA